jgi:5'-nucleotidase
VHLAISGFLPDRPDLILSGINDGANLGDDVLYSGTVAAAMEGRSLGVPALAFSLIHNEREPRFFDSAQAIVQRVVGQLKNHPLPKATLYNINIPNLPLNEIKGFQVTRLGQRHPADKIVKTHDPRGRVMYWVGGPGDGHDAGEGTDFGALADGYVSITPLMIDLTDVTRLSELKQWVGKFA